MTLPKVIQTALLDFYKVAASDHTPAAVMSQIYLQLDTIWQEVVDSGQYTPDFQCSAGCGYCCYLPVMCPPEVVFHVAHEIQETWTPAQIDALVHDIAAVMDSFAPPQDIRDLTMRVRCPFLDENNQCRIYAVRPISCRSFTSNNVALCESLARLGAGAEDGVQQNQFRYMLHQAATSSLMLASKNSGRAYEQVFFLPAIRAALLSRQMEQEWTNGQDVFGVLEK